MAASVALLDVAAERRGAAQFDRAHRAELAAAQRIGVRFAIGRAEAAENIRHFERRRTHRLSQK